MKSPQLLLSEEACRDLSQCPVLNLSLIVPVYNEEDTVDIFVDRVSLMFADASDLQLELIFVNDGSCDDTLTRLLSRQRQDGRIRIVDLTRHFGKESALSAGLDAATGRVLVPIDVDLQDPPELIFKMITHWRQGFDVVIARRSHRGSDTWTKRQSATWFYRIHNWIAEPKLPENAGDFRLMDRMVVDALGDLPESRRFMKGLFAWVGFRTTFIDYVRPPRISGTSKFNGWRLWNLALEGLTSFSTAPLRIWTYLGGVVAVASLLYGAFIAMQVLVHGVDLPGYASVFVAVTFLGGLQLIGIGIVGEYLGRAYLESKRRPCYLVRRIYDSGG